MSAGSPEGAPHVVILAAGAGAPRSRELGALTPVFYRPMIRLVLDAAAAIPHRSLVAIAGSDEDRVRQELRGESELRYARREASGAAGFLAGLDGDVLVLDAGRVLMTPASLLGLLACHAKSGAACTVAAAAGERGAYCFRLADLLGVLRRREPADFLPDDAAAALEAGGLRTAEYALDDPLEALRVDDLHALWRAETVLRGRLHRALMLRGVALRDPSTTQLDPACRIAAGVVIEGGVTVLNSALDSGVCVESGCRIMDSEIGAGTRVQQGTRIEKSRVGGRCVLGPYANLRPGTRLDDGVRIGNFVETKNASIGSGTKVSHLSYVGDAVIGRDVNVGCGFITCNYDGGPVKQRTIVEDGVFIGSASQAIAPVTLGAGSFVATGTSVTEDVPPDSFVISRGRQVTKPGYAKKYGRGRPPAGPPVN